MERRSETLASRCALVSSRSRRRTSTCVNLFSRFRIPPPRAAISLAYLAATAVERGERNPALTGKTPPAPEKTSLAHRSAGRENFSSRKKESAPPGANSPPAATQAGGPGPTMSGRKQTDGQGGYRDDPDPDGEEGGFPPNTESQGKVLSRGSFRLMDKPNTI